MERWRIRRYPSRAEQSYFPYPHLEPERTEPTLMGEFSEKDLLKVYSVGKVQSFRAGEIMVTEWSGEPALYVIMEGTAEVLMPRRNGWYKLASLGPAGVFGELSFFDRLTRSARVVVLIECNVLKIDDHAFESLREIDTKLALNLVLDLGKMLSHRLRNMNDLVRTLVR